MLFPKKVAHRKSQTGRKSEKRRMRPDTRGITVAFGAFGLRALTARKAKTA